MCMNNKVIKTGFWLKPDVWDSLCKEDLGTDGIYLHSSASLFLHEICGVFALALHHQYGYPLVMVTDGEERDEECDPFSRMVHIFCVDSRDGEDFFIDVRGATNDEQLFLAGFEDFICEHGVFEDVEVTDCRDFVCGRMSAAEYNGYYAAAMRFIREHARFF